MYFAFSHFVYLILVAAAAGLVFLGLKGKSVVAKEKTLNRIALLLVLSCTGALLGDPMAMDAALIRMIFRACSLMAALILLSRYCKPCFRFREPVMLTGMAVALLYLIFPDAGYAQGRLMDMLQHGLLVVYGVVAICTGMIKVNLKKLYQVVICVTAVMAWDFAGGRLGNHASTYAKTAAVNAESCDWMTPIAMILTVTAMAAAVCLIPALIAKCKREKKEDMVTILIADRRAV